jgi:hypothetical protein
MLKYLIIKVTRNVAVTLPRPNPPRFFGPTQAPMASSDSCLDIKSDSACKQNAARTNDDASLAVPSIYRRMGVATRLRLRFKTCVFRRVR